MRSIDDGISEEKEKKMTKKMVKREEKNFPRKEGRKKVHLKWLVVQMVLFVFFCMPLTVSAAGNPAENIREIGLSWIQPIFYMAVAGFGVYLFFKRKITELVIVAVLGVIAAVLIFNTEAFVTFLEGLGTLILK